ncbi:hypothetical protein DM01DRAFT_1336876 [Hesseltinella vesiculosa]|uniref:PCI domain-containing protein n=1 Tax=Hesseltinella vesiculosa TaxID=101127 RepID=A0A1X2GED5_9FUNG|nr:hypothetical protein DM01DRAFT_1336876 [Hesseltinella vesiculosa]
MAQVFRGFTREVSNAYDMQDVERLVELFTLDQHHHELVLLQQALNSVHDTTVYSQIVSQTLDNVSISLANFTTRYLDYAHCLREQNKEKEFDMLELSFSALIPMFNSSEGATLVPLVTSYASAIVAMALQIDKALDLRGKQRKANTAVRLLSKVFNMMLADRTTAEPGHPTKRLGIYHITNLTFKLYFKLGTVRMCQTMISNLRTGGVILEEYPIGQQVTYQYYLGRYHLLHNRLPAAEKCLFFAFTKCHYDYWTNKRTILKYLIPTRLLLGRLPSKELLEKYALETPFAQLIATVKSGNYAHCMRVLEDHFAFFYQCSTYVLLCQRLPVLIWRCALKRARDHLSCIENRPIHLYDLKICKKALEQSMAAPMEDEEAEAIIVSLVAQGYIKGYIHHRRQVIVCSKNNAFPQMDEMSLLTEVYNEDAEREQLEYLQSQAGHLMTMDV